MQKSMLKNSVFNIIYTASNILFPFITSIYVSRILLPVGVGKVASAQNIASYFVTAAALGLPSYGVREFAKVREDTAKKNSLFTELFIINLISTTISLIAYIFVLILNNGFNGEGALYICCGLAIFFNYLNLIKFICAFLVIGIHTRQFLSVSDIADRLFYYDVSNYSVPFFYACSGYFLLAKKSNIKLGDRLKIRIRKVLRLYLVCTLWPSAH